MANLLILEWNQLAVILEQIVCFIVNFGVFHETDCWVGCGVEFVWLKLPNLQIRGEIIDVGDNYVTLEFFFFFVCVCGYFMFICSSDLLLMCADLLFLILGSVELTEGLVEKLSLEIESCRICRFWMNRLLLAWCQSKLCTFA